MYLNLNCLLLVITESFYFLVTPRDRFLIPIKMRMQTKQSLYNKLKLLTKHDTLKF